MKRRTVPNTEREAAEHPELALLGAIVHGSSGAIEHMEAEGQRELCSADVLPACGSEAPAIAALGIEWGEAVPGDALFRYAALPAGWRKRPTDHAMWSEIVDSQGAVRARVFYKAAHYDRRGAIEPA